ncbi:MAG TPA: aspartate/glutamate racemase family protein [Burkholderiaceae bacterium]|nr:aspartate/glutamate racemase family protein [Burkholderiaceae bacterium]
MRLQVLNPNTSAAMTAQIAAAARAAAATGTEIVAAGSTCGPMSIESAFDEALALPGLLQALRAGQGQGVQGHVIACFGDPGLDAAREVADAPVIGIAEAAMQVAALLAPRFAIVTTLERTVGTAERLVTRYGHERRCTAVRATGLPVLALERAAEDPTLYAQVEAECRRALDADRAEAIVLGCAGMAPLAARLAQALQVPVIDGVVAAVKLAEALAGARWRTSKRGDWAAPPAKPMAGQIAQFVLS